MCQKRIFALERRGFEWEIRHSAPKNNKVGSSAEETNDDNNDNVQLEDTKDDGEHQDQKPPASDDSFNLSPTPLDKWKV